eukprot:364895-Chlamydomonas_euryale.AAC.5
MGKVAFQNKVVSLKKTCRVFKRSTQEGKPRCPGGSCSGDSCPGDSYPGDSAWCADCCNHSGGTVATPPRPPHLPTPAQRGGMALARCSSVPTLSTPLRTCQAWQEAPRSMHQRPHTPHTPHDSLAWQEAALSAEQRPPSGRASHQQLSSMRRHERACKLAHHTSVGLVCTNMYGHVHGSDEDQGGLLTAAAAPPSAAPCT